jgi:hypothetical protein
MRADSVVFGALLFAVLIPCNGYTSEVFYQKISLKQLVASSPVIAVVEQVENSTGDTTLAIDSPLHKPPATHVNYRTFAILKIIKNSTGKPLPPRIFVGEAFRDEKLAEQKLYKEKGIMESPIFRAYRVNVPPKGPRIVFLQEYKQDDLDFIFAVEGSCETVEKSEMIVKMVAEKEKK